MWASSANAREVTRVLIDNGADINTKDKQGQSILSVAPDMRMVRLLQAAGAKK